MQTPKAGSVDPGTRAERPNDADRPRRIVDSSEVDQFKNMLDLRRLHQQLQGEHPEQAQTLDQDALTVAPTPLSTAEQDQMALAALMASQQTWQAAASAPEQLAGTLPTPIALGELLERHVRRLLASESAARDGDGDGRIRLSLNDDTLPATELTLERNSEGWRLIAEVGSRDSFDTLRDFAPALIERFAERNLGQLQIEPELLENRI